MLKSYFELLCTSLTLVAPIGKSPPSVNYTLCTGHLSMVRQMDRFRHSNALASGSA